LAGIFNIEQKVLAPSCSK